MVLTNRGRRTGRFGIARNYRLRFRLEERPKHIGLFSMYSFKLHFLIFFLFQFGVSHTKKLALPQSSTMMTYAFFSAFSAFLASSSSFFSRAASSCESASVQWISAYLFRSHFGLLGRRSAPSGVLRGCCALSASSSDGNTR